MFFLFQEMKYMPPQPHVQPHNGHPGLPQHPWLGHGGPLGHDPWSSMSHYTGLHPQPELKQEIKPLPADYGRVAAHHPAMHHSMYQPPVTGAYLGMGTNSGTNSPSPVHALQHPAYAGMNGKCDDMTDTVNHCEHSSNVNRPPCLSLSPLTGSRYLPWQAPCLQTTPTLLAEEVSTVGCIGCHPPLSLSSLEKHTNTLYTRRAPVFILALKKGDPSSGWVLQPRKYTDRYARKLKRENSCLDVIHISDLLWMFEGKLPIVHTRWDLICRLQRSKKLVCKRIVNRNPFYHSSAAGQGT